MATSATRLRPNILIAGTPGTGKSTLAAQVADSLGFTHIDVGKEIRENDLHSGYDEEYKCHVLDEDKLLDHLEDRLNATDGGYVLDYHGCDFFPERWFDLVAVLRCDNTILYDRLKTRGYPEKKLRENVECEIFGTLLDEATDSYPADVVKEFQSDTLEQMEENAEVIVDFAKNWKPSSVSDMES
uniref:Adenylate kinase isoenzyme 6 homolog n=1 Tax=Plectus sambesii TaxID=2011161 RepID=A0A914WYF6_9BILA